MLLWILLFYLDVSFSIHFLIYCSILIYLRLFFFLGWKVFTVLVIIILLLIFVILHIFFGILCYIDWVYFVRFLLFKLNLLRRFYILFWLLLALVDYQYLLLLFSSRGLCSLDSFCRYYLNGISLSLLYFFTRSLLSFVVNSVCFLNTRVGQGLNVFAISLRSGSSRSKFGRRFRRSGCQIDFLIVSESSKWG